jgi:hypothetical protein
MSGKQKTVHDYTELKSYDSAVKLLQTLQRKLALCNEVTDLNIMLS